MMHACHDTLSMKIADSGTAAEVDRMVGRRINGEDVMIVETLLSHLCLTGKGK